MKLLLKTTKSIFSYMIKMLNHTFLTFWNKKKHFILYYNIEI